MATMDNPATVLAKDEPAPAEAKAPAKGRFVKGQKHSPRTPRAALSMRDLVRSRSREIVRRLFKILGGTNANAAVGAARALAELGQLGTFDPPPPPGTTSRHTIPIYECAACVASETGHCAYHTLGIP